MITYYGLEECKLSSKPVVTLGSFDGLHLGHKSLIQNVVNQAKLENAPSLVITFEPHPRLVLQKNIQDFKLLNTIQEKIIGFETTQIDILLILEFSLEFSKKSYNQFVKEILVDGLGIESIIIGYDHQFGNNREGTVETLTELAKIYDFKVLQIPPSVIDNNAISSSKIRKHLEKGELNEANQLLGYHYFVSGIVVHGNKIGRTLGFPTANIHFDNNYKLLPADGVYAGKLLVDNIYYNAVISLGIRPTFDFKERLLEVYLPNQNINLYDKNVKVEFFHRVRPQLKFNSKEELISQMHKDVDDSLSLLAQ